MCLLSITYPAGQLVPEIFGGCADGAREAGTVSVPRGAAKLLMSKTSLSPPLNFYSGFQNPKLNAQALCFITVSTENPIDAGKCMCACAMLYIPGRNVSMREMWDLPFEKPLPGEMKGADFTALRDRAEWGESSMAVKSWKAYKGLIPQLLVTAAVLWHTDWWSSCLIHRFHF